MILRSLFVATVISLSLSAGSALAGISAQVNYCGNNNYCTAQLNWAVTNGKKYVITAEMITANNVPDSKPKVFGCGYTSGWGEANWIAAGHTYVFKIYENDDCTAAVSQLSFPVDSTAVTSYGAIPAPSQIQGFKTAFTDKMVEFDIHWSSKAAISSSVMTVEIPGQGEKIVSCAGAAGKLHIDWVAKGNIYRFRLYDSNYCQADIGKYLKASAQMVLFEP